MFPNEYDLHEHHKDLLHQAEQHRLVRQTQTPSISLTRRAGQNLLKIGAKLAVDQSSDCTTLESGNQVVTVCPA